MNQKKWVISLGGSKITPGDVDFFFIKEFKSFILSHKDHKFVVVTGGGTTARKYIDALKKLKCKLPKQSSAGIAITRFHASYLMNYFGKVANDELPFSTKKVSNLLKKNQIVFCGALEHKKDQTTDATSAKIAAKLKCPFINLTNVKGLFDKDPRKNPDAKLVKNISWNDFNNITKKIKFSAGQHFILDQKASKIIKKYKIPTYIVGTIRDMKQIIKGQTFAGTKIEG